MDTNFWPKVYESKTGKRSLAKIKQRINKLKNIPTVFKENQIKILIKV